MEDITKTKRKFITSPLGRLGGVLILLACLFAACSSDDDPEYFNPIEGKWIDVKYQDEHRSVRVYKSDFHIYIYI